MRKAVFGGVALLLFAILLRAGGNEPWKSKPMSQWTDQDIQRVYSESPWSRTVKVEGTWKPLSAAELNQNREMNPNTTVGAGGSGGARAGGTATVLPAEHSDSQTRGVDVTFFVYWVSSRTMRTASQRSQVLHGSKDEAEAETFVAQPVDEYQILVKGPDLAPFYRHEEIFFKDNSALELKKSKQKLSPSHVSIERDGSAKIIGAVFYFPRKNSSGGEVVTPEEKNVEFTCKLGSSTLHALFEPKNMSDSRGPDF